MKCDEAKPNCRKCTSTGRKCDGYPVLETTPADSFWSASDSKTLAILSPCGPPLDLLGGGKQRHSFHFFRSITASQLSGFCGDGFWDKLVLQASHHEPAIRHAVIALGSLHGRFIRHNGLLSRCDPLLHLDEFALQEYSLAIKCLYEQFSRQDKPAVDVCLVSCVLFACFEVRFYFEFIFSTLLRYNSNSAIEYARKLCSGHCAYPKRL